MSPKQLSSFNYQGLYDTLRQNGYQSNRDFRSHIRNYSSWIKRNLKYETLLDIGSGSGGSFRLFKGRYKKLTGVDVSAVAVQKGIALGRDVVLASATELPFNNDAFDLVVSSDVFEHLHPDDVEQAVNEAVRVSKRNIFMKIATREDVTQIWKEIAGHPLHLTIQPIDWWIDKFLFAGRLVWHDAHAFCIELE